MVNKWVLVLLTALLSPLAWADEPNYDEQYRPQFHFTPQRNWMNDPNGLVYLEGEYHLFYQYNPFGNRWGHMSWGHAVSQDLVHWEHLPIAIPEENGVMAFSGSAVVDVNNTSGFGRPGQTPLVAIYTGYRPADRNQAQYLAFSLDRGRTWTRYAGNPVLDIGSRDFRDPKVFWYEPDQRWIMVLALAAERTVSFYASPDLKQWQHLSNFGPAGAIGGAWECPDLFPLEVEGSPGLKRWVLEVDVDRRAEAGGSGGQYFIGSFDGRRFLRDEPRERQFPSPRGEILATFDEGLPADWERKGDAFEIAPSATVVGGRGLGVLHSGRSGGGATGSLTSSAFPLERSYLSFLIGGGRNKDQLAVELLVDDQVVRTSGYNGDVLDWITWDIRPFRKRSAVLRLTDQSTDDYWGHLVVDHIVLSNDPARSSVHHGRWVDYGTDFYAAQSWSGIPTSDGRRIWLAWMNNWLYAEDLPTAPWRSAMTIPRVVSLRAEEGSLHLVQEPIRELRKLRTDPVAIAATSISAGEKVLAQIRGDQLELEATFEVGSAEELGLIVHRASDGQGTIVGYDVRQGQLFVDRRGTGQDDFHSAFPVLSNGPLAAPNGRVKLHIFVDRSSVEVFGNDGRTVLTTRVFPKNGSHGVALFAKNGDARLLDLKAWKLRSIWSEASNFSTPNMEAISH